MNSKQVNKGALLGLPNHFASQNDGQAELLGLSLLTASGGGFACV